MMRINGQFLIIEEEKVELGKILSRARAAFAPCRHFADSLPASPVQPPLSCASSMADRLPQPEGSLCCGDSLHSGKHIYGQSVRQRAD
jgi:hypothetical protein